MEALSLAEALGSLGRGLRDFWFAPGDPTTLGFVRISTGLVLLYVLLVSGPLLSSFYAPDGWIDAEASDTLRKDFPWNYPEPAWEREDGVPAWFFEMDRDGDGFVTRKEWTGFADEFDHVDVKNASWFAEMDRDRDGFVTRKEWTGDPEEFDRIAGKDGRITREAAERYGPIAGKDGRISAEEAKQHGAYLVVRPELWQGPKERQAATRRAWERWGTDPSRTNDTGQPFFSHFFHLETAAERNVAHALGLLVALLFTLGVGTRVTSVLAWVVALGYAHRLCAVAIFGMDTMMAIALLYLMIGPSGAALSVDHWLANWRRRRAGLPELEPEKSSMATLATRLLQVHFCVMYFAAGATKLQGAAWWNGTAIWQTLTNYEFAPRGGAYTGALRLLSMNRWVWELFNVGGAYATVALEISLPFLIWHRRWRWLLMCGSVSMHLCIGLTMGLEAFSLFMICILFAFVPPETLKAALAQARALLTRLTRQARPAPQPREEAPAAAAV
jgi:hypothetical protein